MKFKDLADHFQKIYGRNNSIYITSLHERIAILSVVCRSLQDSIRKQKSKEEIGHKLANLVSRTFAVVNHFYNLPISRAMCVKYPMGGCGYCHQSPCQCKGYDRPKHKVTDPNPAQLEWTIADHQRSLDSLYGRNNRKSGIENAINRMFAELAEISELQVGFSSMGSLAKDLEEEYAKEIADMFAWIIAIAVILDIDLDACVQNSYGSGCPACSHIPCECPQYVVYGKEVKHFEEAFPGSKTSS